MTMPFKVLNNYQYEDIADNTQILKIYSLHYDFSKYAYLLDQKKSNYVYLLILYIYCNIYTLSEADTGFSERGRGLSGVWIFHTWDIS